MFAPGNITVSHQGAPAGGSTIQAGLVDLESDGTFNAGAGSLINGANGVDIRSDGDLSVGNLGIGSSTGFISLAAAGTAGFTGTVNGQAVFVESSDIDIAQGASLGGEGGSLSLNILANGQPATIGGDGSGPGYVLDADEALRLGAGFINVSAPVSGSGAGPDIILQDLRVNGSLAGSGGGGGTGRTFQVDAAGFVQIAGVVGMQNAGDLDAFNIFAGERVELTPGALLGLQGPDEIGRAHV